jgi:hypothetical protein
MFLLNKPLHDHLLWGDSSTPLWSLTEAWLRTPACCVLSSMTGLITWSSLWSHRREMSQVLACIMCNFLILWNSNSRGLMAWYKVIRSIENNSLERQITCTCNWPFIQSVTTLRLFPLNIHIKQMHDKHILYTPVNNTPSFRCKP